MRSRVLPTVLGCVGLVLVVPILVVMGIVVANEEHAGAPTGPSVVEGTIVSPDTERGPIGAPFVYGRVKTYATYNRGGRRMYGSVQYIDEHRGTQRVTLSTSAGPVVVDLPDPFTTWRNAHPDQQAYGTPAQVPGWQQRWQLPERMREIVVYVLAVRSGQTLLVDKAPSATVVWIGGRGASDDAMARQSVAQRNFSIGSFVGAGLCALASLVLVAVGFLRRGQR